MDRERLELRGRRTGSKILACWASSWIFQIVRNLGTRWRLRRVNRNTETSLHKGNREGGECREAIDREGWERISEAQERSAPKQLQGMMKKEEREFQEVFLRGLQWIPYNLLCEMQIKTTAPF